MPYRTSYTRRTHDDTNTAQQSFFTYFQQCNKNRPLLRDTVSYSSQDGESHFSEIRQQFIGYILLSHILLQIYIIIIRR